MGYLAIDRDLLAAAEKTASQRGQTLMAFIEDALRQAVDWNTCKPLPPSGGRRRLELPTFRGEGLQPGVNLDESASLLDLMELPSHAPD